MALLPGSTLGPYEVAALLGQGGMGEVYRATDTRLGRQVAIKVLPDIFAGDTERVARFEREARALAALNHPSIAQIYGVEVADGTPAIVMELVEGDDLAERLTQGRMPIDEALPIARQIAEALEAAHEQGIIHRDLKPANIKVTPQGVVKVLDFGLAKLADPTAPSSAIRTPAALSMSPTMVSPAAMTGAGVLLGTAAYMSPEQAKGRDADRRSDVWAFGCVLFEMLAGRRAFDGEDVADALVAVLSKEPDWSALPSDTPPCIKRLLRRCLTRDRTLRLQSIGDARLEIHEALTSPAESVAEPSVPSSPTTRRYGVAIGVASLVIGALIATPAVWTLKPTIATPLVHLAVPVSPDERLPFTQSPLVAIAPDESRVAFVTSRDGVRQLSLRRLDGGEATRVAGSEGAESPFFSPDSQWVAFTANGNLLKVAVAGGTPLVVSKAPDVRGASWGIDGTIVFAAGYGVPGVSAVSDAGGTPRMLVARADDSNSEGYRWPQLLSTQRVLLFTAWTRNIDDSQIIAQRLDTGERKVVVRGGTHARYVAPNRLLYLRAGTMMAIAFDPARLETTGNPVPVMQQVSMTAEGAGQYDVSRSGSLIFAPGDVLGSGRTLVWVDRTGREQPLGAPPRYYMTPRLSPDGQRVAVSIAEANDDVWVFDTGRQTLSRLTSEHRSVNPVWTPDGNRIVYRSLRDGRLNLYARNADGSGTEERLTTSDVNQNPFVVSPDGQMLVFFQTPDIWAVPLAGDRKPRPLVQSPFRKGSAAVSPDGTWMAYTSDESGRQEIYAQPFPDGGAKIQISTAGGQLPRWSSSGELFFLSPSKTLMAVKVNTTPTFSAEKPQALFGTGQYVDSNIPYDVTKDGQRFLMIKEDNRPAESSRIDLVLNWNRELSRLLPP